VYPDAFGRLGRMFSRAVGRRTGVRGRCQSQFVVTHADAFQHRHAGAIAATDAGLLGQLDVPFGASEEFVERDNLRLIEVAAVKLKRLKLLRLNSMGTT
jgi:hypothetical protein